MSIRYNPCPMCGSTNLSVTALLDIPVTATFECLNCKFMIRYSPQCGYVEADSLAHFWNEGTALFKSELMEDWTNDQHR